MSSPPIPPPVEDLGGRAFSFYPPVLNIEHNEWMFKRSTWSEILVVNTKTSAEIWVPRRFLGEISRIDEPVMIVGLLKELEYRSGMLFPHERRIIELPRAAGGGPKANAAPEKAPAGSVVGIRLESDAESRVGLLIGAVLILGVLACFLVVSMFRGRNEGRVAYIPVLQQQLGLSPLDDVHAIQRKIGRASEDRWRSEAGELQYRILVYPERGLSLILMGKDRESVRYIGAMDHNWKVIDSVDLPHSGNTRSMLQSLGRF
jgi:hypothetical protein